MAEHLKYIASNLLANGGLKVSLADALAYGVDGIATGPRMVGPVVVYNAATLTANHTQTFTGFAGTRLALLELNITALTLDTATGVVIALQRLLPSGGACDLANQKFTATGNWIYQVRADATSSIFQPTNLSLTFGQVKDGPWDDSLRVALAWDAAAGAGSSVTLSARLLATG